MTERVVLYNDLGPQGVQGAEVWDRGIPRVRDVVAMPHARRQAAPRRPRARAGLRAPLRAGRLPAARRRHPVEIGDDGVVPEDARVLTETGAKGGVL